MTAREQFEAAPVGAAAPRAQGAMAQLDHNELVASHTLTLSAPRRRYGLNAKILFALLDVIYGKSRTLSKFKVLELVARVPYQAWEQVAYIAITHTSSHPDFARRVFDRVTEARGQEDNEQWHLLILEGLIAKENTHEGWVKFTVIPQVVAFGFYQLSWLLYVIRPAWSYRLNADFEDHAEHEYAHLVRTPRMGTPTLRQRLRQRLRPRRHRRRPVPPDQLRRTGPQKRQHCRHEPAPLHLTNQPTPPSAPRFERGARDLQLHRRSHHPDPS